MEQRKVSFFGAVKRAFNNYANFNGRASRSEYWWWALFSFIIGILFGWIPILGWLVALALFIPGLAIAWRRLHDMGRAGGWWFLGLIPVVGAIILIIWYVQPSQPFENRFGKVPNVVHHHEKEELPPVA